MRHRSPPPSSNRTCGFPASGFPESSQPKARTGGVPCLATGPAPISVKRLNPVLGHAQAVLLTSHGNRDPAGALRSTGITPLPRYYFPLRLPARPSGGYSFPSPVDPTSRSFHPDGSPRFLGRSVDARRPLPPRGVRPLPVLVAWRPMSGFTSSGRLATPRLGFHEAGPGSLTLRLASSPSQASTAGLPRTPLSRLHGERAISMVSTFQLTRSTRLILAHPSEPSGSTMRSNPRTAWWCGNWSGAGRRL
jgi:hypothetical protein